jgi:hypothetical protein
LRDDRVGFWEGVGVAYVLEGDALVGDVLDRALGVRNSLDANTVVGVDDLRVEDLHGVDDVVVAAADGADGETVAAGAVAAGESDVSAGVDGEAVVLVVDGGAGDGDVLRVTDVESVGVVAALRVTVLVVDGDVVDRECVGVVDREDLDGGVLDCLGIGSQQLKILGGMKRNVRCP